MKFEIIKTDDAVVDIKEFSQGGVDYAKISVKYGKPCVPEILKIVFYTELIDAAKTWTPIMTRHDIRPEWAPIECTSALAKSMPLLGFVSENCRNRGLATLSDVKNRITLSVGVVEETCEAKWCLKLFERTFVPIDCYEVTLRLDNRDIKFTDAVKDVSKWWEALGYIPAVSPDAAFHATYSTWYNFHQRVTFDQVIAELKLAKDLGFKTVIVDDGWQCDDNSRGYTYTGDWKPAASKIGNVRDFCDKCHELGLKAMFWYTVPFVGKFANSYKRFKDKSLYAYEEGWVVLDPRYKEVRDYLIELYASALKEYGLDGLKLDFIDCFTMRKETITKNDEMDIPVLEDAVYKLMSDVYATLKSINPDVLIEFRQSYVGPMIRSFGNMLRVTDCPYSADTNIRAIAELRLTSGNTAIHSDMLMWHNNTPDTDAARQLLSTMFAVPQISVMLKNLSDGHASVVREFINYREENLELLMHGDFDCDFPSACSFMTAFNDKKQITVLYRGNLFVLENKNTDVFFATVGDNRVLDLAAFDCDFILTVKDCFGKQVETLTARGLTKIFVPECGRVEIRLL